MIQTGAPCGFIPLDIPSVPFRLSGLLKNGGGADLVVYLEGDGRAFVRGRPTADPSPRKAQAYALALLDPGPTVLYLARVGQFQPGLTGKAFQPYWTTRRLAPESVNAANDAIDQVLALTSGKRVHLVGYSGGGGLAALIAQRRKDVFSLVTVAGLLDTAWWIRTEKYPPLDGSLNPAGHMEDLKDLPQIHFYGEKDRIIKPAMSAHVRSVAQFMDFRRIGVPTGHGSGWTVRWSQFLETYIIPLREQAKRLGAN